MNGAVAFSETDDALSREREREREREGATAKSLIAWDYAEEVIYSMLERVQPAQATAGSVAGGRPSYHSNCGRVARSV